MTGVQTCALPIYTNQKLMLQAASEFGLTPSSRSRIVAGSAKGKEPEDEMEALLGGDS